MTTSPAFVPASLGRPISPSQAPENGRILAIAGFRAKASTQRALVAYNIDPDRIGPGEISGGWIAARHLRTFHVEGSLPFVDVESPATHTFLTEHASELLLQHDIENLDVAHVRGPNRLLTRAIAG